MLVKVECCKSSEYDWFLGLFNKKQKKKVKLNLYFFKRIKFNIKFKYYKNFKGVYYRFFKFPNHFLKKVSNISFFDFKL